MNIQHRKGARPGFSLLELMVAIVIIAVLVVLLITALDPIGEFGRTNNVLRKQDLAKIAHAMATYAEEDANFLSSIPLAPTDAIEICGDPNGSQCGARLNLYPIISAGYLDAIPIDPASDEDPDGITEASGYYAVRPAVLRVTLTAPSTEAGEAIVELSF